MKINSLLNIFLMLTLSLLLFACVEPEPEEVPLGDGPLQASSLNNVDDIAGDSSDDGNGDISENSTDDTSFNCNPKLDGNIESGKKMYSGNSSTFGQCIACHKIKKNKTCEQIKAAFSFGGMAHLKKPTEQQLANLTAYLNSFSSTPPIIIVPTGTVSVVYKQPIATKSLMAARFTYLFNTPKYSSSIVSKVRYLIKEQPGSFGGTCAFVHENCLGRDIDGALASMLPSMNVVRKGYLLRLCGEITMNNTAVANILSKVSFSEATQASELEINKLVELFYFGRTVDQKTKDGLVDIFKIAKSKGMSNRDAWRFVFYSLCTAPLFEML